MRALAAHGKPAAVPEPPVASKVHEALDAHGNFGAEVALDLKVRVDNLTYCVYLSVGQIIAFNITADCGHLEYLLRGSPTDAVNICKRNLDALVLR